MRKSKARMSQRIREGREVSVFTRLSRTVCPSGCRCRIIQSQGTIGQPGRPPARGTEGGLEPDDLLCSRNARSLLPSLDARSGRPIRPHPSKTMSKLGGNIYIVRRAQSRINQATLPQRKRGIIMRVLSLTSPVASHSKQGSAATSESQ